MSGRYCVMKHNIILMSDVEDHNKSLGVGHNYLSPCLVKSYITALLFDISSAIEAV